MLLAKVMKICCLVLLPNLCCHLLGGTIPDAQKSPFPFSYRDDFHGDNFFFKIGHEV